MLMGWCQHSACLWLRHREHGGGGAGWGVWSATGPSQPLCWGHTHSCVQVTPRASSARTQGPGLWQCCFFGEPSSSPGAATSPSQNLLGVSPGKEWLALTQAQLKREKKIRKKKIEVLCSSKTQNRSRFLPGKRKFLAPHGGARDGWRCGTALPWPHACCPSVCPVPFWCWPPPSSSGANV